MADARQREMVLATNEFAFILDRTTGQVNVFRGPHKEALSADFRPVIWKDGRFVEVDSESCGEAIRPFVKATEEQYVVLRNPEKTKKDMTNGKNNAIALETGKAVVLRGPTEFPLWPGQEADVLDGHQLSEDEYLKIRVTGPIDSKDAEALWKIVREEWREESVGADALVAKPAAEHFPLGAEFIVRGLKTTFFIPPTGITVVPVETTKGSADFYIRRGTLLNADEYVILVNRVGRVSYVYGPTTVIPCIDQGHYLNPENGSPIYKAVAIDENSGVLLRTLAEMAVSEVKTRVPGVNILGEPENNILLPPGTQLVVSKENRLVFPADGVEIVNKFNAVHIHAGTARYVKNLHSGETRVVQGEKLYLADPRVEEFVERKLSAEQIQLWFPQGASDASLVPRITVPQGTAAMVLGVDAEGKVTRQILVGHTYYFLKWDETLAELKVSGSKPGQPKDWKNAIHVCYLWTTGNRINDCMNGRSRDDCEFTIDYTLTVDFDPEHSNDWFNVDDYVYLVCDEVRSRLLGALLAFPINDIATNFVNLVRDVVLGKKEGEKHRPGIVFSRCGAKLVDINVKSFKIVDAHLEASLKKLQQAGVNDSIKTREAEILLSGELQRLRIESQRLETEVQLNRAKAEAAVQDVETAEEQRRRSEAAKRKTEEERVAAERLLAELRVKIEQELVLLNNNLEKAKLELRQANEKTCRLHTNELETLVAEMKHRTAEVDAQCAKLAAEGRLALLAPEMATARQRLEATITEITANGEAAAKVNASIMPSIAADLRLLADTDMASRVAEALGRVATFRGMDVTELLAQLSGGSPVVSRALDALKGLVIPSGPNGSGASKTEASAE